MENHLQFEIGNKIREQRKNLGITINELSKLTNLTASFISQFERGRTKASLTSTKKIAEALGLDMSELFETTTNSKAAVTEPILTHQTTVPYLVRKNDRPKLSYPVTLNESNYDFLLSHPTNNLQVHITEVKPGDSGSKNFSQYGREEFILILKGTFELQLEENHYVLHNGDSITFSSSLNRIWKNPSDDVSQLLWILYK